MRPRIDILNKKDEILQWVSENLPNAEIARRLKCKVDTLKSYYKKLGIIYGGNMSRAGFPHIEARKPIEEILNGNCSNAKKRLRLIEEGIKEARCECCGLSTWNGKPIPLELHHKDLNHYNNDLDNLQILCSNCHMQAHGYNNNLSAPREILDVESSLTNESLDSSDIIGGDGSLN